VLIKSSTVAHVVQFAILAALSADVNLSNAQDLSGAGLERLQCKVVDGSGQGIPGVAVEILGSEGRLLHRTKSAGNGEFSFSVPPGEVRLRLHHADFDGLEETLQIPTSNQPLVLTLLPPKLHEVMTVTATRTEQPLETVPAAVRVVSQAELQHSPAVTLDDTLRQVPSFSLFRRSSSLVAHPTTQGVSLRGIGPSGVSRTLVLWDGIPLNDPFGGWVYWSQLDKNSLEQIEISPGGGSSLYGSSALGGVIQLLSRTPESNNFELDLQGGSQSTAGGDFLGSYMRGPWSGNFSGSFLHTDGYLIVPESSHGLVDDRAGSVRYTVRAGAFYAPRPGRSAFLQASHFAEDRDNGTSLQRNTTDMTRARIGYRQENGQGSEWQFRGYGLVEKFFSNFSAISANRRVETLTVDQTVPVRSAGGSAQWTGLLLSRHLVTSGLDWQWVRGNSEELSFASGLPSRFQVAGGSQQVGGIFLQDLFTPANRWFIQLSARVDGWTNYGAERRELQLANGARSSSPFIAQKRGTVNPRAGLSYSVTDDLTIRGSYYHSFRAPTLNELYRGFRVGNVVTNPNDSLGPEKLRGTEAGVDWRLAGHSVRVTGFWNQLENAVANVSVSSLPNLITRRRENVGKIQARGIELEGALRWKNFWSLRGAYMLSDSKIIDFPPNPILESKLLPQVPRHRITASLNYSNPRTLDAFVSARFVGAQFDDDLNQLILGNFMVADIFCSRALRRSLRVYVAAENLFDRRFAVARTPVANIGAPRMVHAGLRLSF